MNRLSRKRKRLEPFVGEVKAPEQVTTPADPATRTENVNNSILTANDEPGTGVPLPASESSSNSSTQSTKSRSAHNRSRSPARFYREREQSELQNLNDRLSSHVEHMNYLEDENSRLKLQLQTMEVYDLETQSMKQIHDTDIKTLQELLDTTRQENTCLLHDLESIKQERDTMRNTLVEKDVEMTALREQREKTKAFSHTFEAQQIELTNLKQSLIEKEEDVKRQAAELVMEKVARKRMEEEAELNKNRYIKEVEYASNRMAKHLENTDQKLEAENEKMINDALSKIREQHATDLTSLKEELTTLYQAKLIDLKTKAERDNSDLLANKKELNASKLKQDNLLALSTRLKMDIAAYKVQIEEEQNKNQDLKNEFEKNISQLQREIVILKQESFEVKAELEDMSGVNMRLGREITTYRVLLEDLENKRPSSKAAFNPKDCSLVGGEGIVTVTKSERNVVEGTIEYIYVRTNEFSNGIQIEEVDQEGRYIILINKTGHVIDLCLWTIQQSSPMASTVQFEIPYNTPLAPGQRALIWSHGASPLVDHHGSLGYVNNNNRPSNTDYLTSNGKDALHVSMHGKQWMERPSSMNIRLQDGDGQLQTKCDLTIVKKEVLIRSHDEGECSNPNETGRNTLTDGNGCAKYMRLLGRANGNSKKLLQKDGCFTM